MLCMNQHLNIEVMKLIRLKPRRSNGVKDHFICIIENMKEFSRKISLIVHTKRNRLISINWFKKGEKNLSMPLSKIEFQFILNSEKYFDRIFFHLIEHNI